MLNFPIIQTSPLVELAVTPLLRSSLRSSAGAQQQPPRVRESRSSDNLLRDGSGLAESGCYAGVHVAAHRRRSNPNILDLLPPPPVYAPPSLASETWVREGRREVERALEQELTCFHETGTQFNQY